MRLRASSGLYESCLDNHRKAGKTHMYVMREIKFYWRREYFPIAGMFTKCLCRNGNISFSKNNLAYSCSLRTCILSVLEYSEHIFPFHMRRKCSLNPKASPNLNAVETNAAAEVPCEFRFEAVLQLFQTGVLSSFHSRSESVLPWHKTGLMMHFCCMHAFLHDRFVHSFVLRFYFWTRMQTFLWCYARHCMVHCDELMSAKSWIKCSWIVQY